MSILVVEPDHDLLDLLIFLLRRASYDVITARDSASALRMWQQQAPDLVLLETDLPGGSGWDVCEAIRAVDETPMIFLSRASSEADIVRGLLLGADDYVTKPFGPQELLVRIQAVLRRVPANRTATHAAGQVLEAGDLVLDPQWRRVRRGETDIHLTGTEFKLLYELVLH